MNNAVFSTTPSYRSRAASLFRAALALCVLQLLNARSAFAAGSGSSFESDVQAFLTQFVDLATGPVVYSIGLLMVIAGLILAGVRQRNGEKWGPILIPVAAIFAVINIDSLLGSFVTAGAGM